MVRYSQFLLLTKQLTIGMMLKGLFNILMQNINIERFKMKIKLLSVLLTLSLLLNISLLFQYENSKRDATSISIGVSSTFIFLYDELEDFYNDFEEFEDGNLSKHELLEQSKKTSFVIYRTAQIIDSYDFLSSEYLEGLYSLSSYFSKFNPDLDSSLEDIKATFKKNSAIRVPQLYREYPKYLDGEIPVQMEQLLSDLNTILN